jgi:transposase
MKAYSLDLRQKVIDAYNRKEGSQRQLAKRFSVSLSLIQDLLKRYGEDGTPDAKTQIDAKKKSFHASERDPERVQRLRVEYGHTLGEVKLTDRVFIDESGVNLAMSRRYARSLEGTRAYGERPDARGKNVDPGTFPVERSVRGDGSLQFPQGCRHPRSP